MDFDPEDDNPPLKVLVTEYYGRMVESLEEVYFQ